MNEEQNLIINIFECLTKAISMLNELAIILDKYHPKTIEELMKAIDKERNSKTD